MLARGFYAILDLGSLGAREPEHVAKELLAGGCVALQLRAKGERPDALLPLARKLAALARDHDTPFIVNDHIDLTREAGAAGVHLGQTDDDLAQARRILPAGGLVGLSTHDLHQAREAAARGADYIGFGPVLPTRTKADADPAQGLDSLARVCRAVDVPVVAIGGITLAHADAVRAAGATAITAISAVLGAPNPAAIARQLHDTLRG